MALCFVSVDNALTNNDWDVLIFTQHWPITVCHEWKEKNVSHTCELPTQENAWTVHGIWPTRFGEIGPLFCNRTWHFDPELVQPIEQELEQFWTNIEKETSKYSFWAHEWNKHGTCAAVVTSLDNEKKYFGQGLKWLQLYSMSTILAKAGIKPSMTTVYKLADVYKAVQAQLGKNPVVECKHDSGSNFMFEIRICFDKDLTLVDCDGVVSNNKYFQNIDNMKIISNCNASESIIYPNILPTQPNSWFRNLIEVYKFITWLQWFTL